MNALAELKETKPLPPPTTEAAKINIWDTWYEDDVLKKWSINTLKFNELIGALGFCRMDAPNGFIFVKVSNGSIVEEVKKTHIQDAVFDHVSSMPKIVDGKKLYRDQVLEKLLKGIGTFFNEEKLYQVRPITPFNFIKDTAHTRLFFFKNCLIMVSKDGRKVLNYDEMPGNVWKNEILTRDFHKTAKASDAMFGKFMELVAGSPERFEELKRITGYLLHQFPYRKNKAVVLTDSALSAAGEANGRTGKSLYAKALGYAISADPELGGTVVNVNGKDFDPSYRHKWQEVMPYTRIVVLDDIKAGFSPESLYNDITEGLTAQKKNDAPFKQRANLIITTNKTMKLDGESDKDRFVEFEFSTFFSSKKSPGDHFKCWFFTGWDPAEWARFDALMIECSQLYFAKGLPTPKSINLEARKLQDHTSTEFIEFMRELKFLWSRPAKAVKENEVERHTDDHYMDKGDLFDQFVRQYPDYGPSGKYKMAQKKFTYWLRDWCKYTNGVAEHVDDRDTYRSDSKSYICFRREE